MLNARKRARTHTNCTMIMRTAKSVIEFFSINAKFVEAVIYGGIEERRTLIMNKKAFSGIILAMLLSCMLTLAFNIQPVKAVTIIVPDGYPTIQEAINAASDGDTIFVRAGTYYEHVVVNKSVSLVGESRENTIIDGNGTGTVITVVASNLTIKGFTIRNSGELEYGIYVECQTNVTIQNNNIANNDDGIRLNYSSNNTIVGNNIANNYYGIWLPYSSNNSIVGNNITGNSLCAVELGFGDHTAIRQNIMTNNGIGVGLLSALYNVIEDNVINDNDDAGLCLIWVDNSLIQRNSIENNGWNGEELFDGIYLFQCSNNSIFHNNLVNNNIQVDSFESTNIWDDGYPSGGNYWSDYAGVDADGDGIGDTPYVINGTNQDRYPLMNPWGSGTPIASFNWSPSIPEVNEPVTFDASASMPVGGEIVSYEWDFGDGNQASGKIVTHRYGSAGNFTVTLNVTDSEGLWSIEQKQIKVKAPPPPLTVSISPTSASILVGESVTFTSTVSGGYTPYTYQWYLNDAPVSGATSDTWTFTPTESGIFYVYLKVTDDKGNTAQSETARITVASVPVGGYSVPINKYTLLTPIATHIALIAILTTIFITVKRKAKRKH